MRRICARRDSSTCTPGLGTALRSPPPHTHTFILECSAHGELQGCMPFATIALSSPLASNLLLVVEPGFAR